MKGKRPLTDEEVEGLISEGFTGRYAKRDRALFAMGINTGFRIGTLLNIRLRHVYRNGSVMKTIQLPASYFKRKKEGQTKNLSPGTRRYLKEWIEELITWPVYDWYQTYRTPGEVFLFQAMGKQNKPMGYEIARRGLLTAAKNIDVYDPGISTHSMRKTASARLISYFTARYQRGEIQTMPVYLVQIFLGHQDPGTTLNYLSFMADDVPDDLLDV